MYVQKFHEQYLDATWKGKYFAHIHMHPMARNYTNRSNVRRNDWTQLSNCLKCAAIIDVNEFNNNKRNTMQTLHYTFHNYTHVQCSVANFTCACATAIFEPESSQCNAIKQQYNNNNGKSIKTKAVKGNQS